METEWHLKYEIIRSNSRRQHTLFNKQQLMSTNLILLMVQLSYRLTRFLSTKKTFIDISQFLKLLLTRNNYHAQSALGKSFERLFLTHTHTHALMLKFVIKAYAEINRNWIFGISFGSEWVREWMAHVLRRWMLFRFGCCSHLCVCYTMMFHYYLQQFFLMFIFEGFMSWRMSAMWALSIKHSIAD